MAFLLGRNPGAKSIHSVGLCNRCTSVFLVRFLTVDVAGVGVGVGATGTSLFFFFFLSVSCFAFGPIVFGRDALFVIPCRCSRATGLTRASFVPGGIWSEVKRAASVAARRAIFLDLGASRSRER